MRIICLFTFILFNINCVWSQIEVENPYEHRMHAYIVSEGRREIDCGILLPGQKAGVSLPANHLNRKHCNFVFIYDDASYKADITDIQNYIDRLERERVVKIVLWEGLKQWFSETKFGDRFNKATDFFEAISTFRDILGGTTSLDDVIVDKVKGDMKSEIISSVDNKLGRYFVAGLIGYIEAGKETYPAQTALMKRLTERYFSVFSGKVALKKRYDLYKFSHINIETGYNYFTQIAYKGSVGPSFKQLGQISEVPFTVKIYPSWDGGEARISLPITFNQSPVCFKTNNDPTFVDNSAITFRNLQVGYRYEITSKPSKAVLGFGVELGYQHNFTKLWTATLVNGKITNLISMEKFRSMKGNFYAGIGLSLRIYSVNLFASFEAAIGWDKMDANGNMIRPANYSSRTGQAGIGIPFTVKRTWRKL